MARQQGRKELRKNFRRMPKAESMESKAGATRVEKCNTDATYQEGQKTV